MLMSMCAVQQAFTIPEFSRSSITPSYLQDKNAGTPFEKLIHQLLQLEGEPVKCFPAGKDGGIDLFSVQSGKVVECKDTDNPFTAWKEVAERLARNLASAEGPPSGQSQYQPWYEPSTELAIKHYHFYFSGIEQNAAKNLELRKQIHDFFNQLAQQHAHLQHLATLEIVVCSWEDVRSRLQRHPQLCLCWFPSMKLPGLKLFKEPAQPNDFRKFLYESALPYCALSFDGNAKSELHPDTILSQLASNEATGVVISGQGGSGKTRLCLEVARAAANSDWLVLELKGEQPGEAIQSIEQYIAKDQKVLLVMDYIETQMGCFNVIANAFYEEKQEGARFRYLANCRTAFYENVRGKYDHIHRELPLFSGEHQVVSHILSQGDIYNWQSYVSSCQGVPVLAVFIVFLHQKQLLEPGKARPTQLNLLRQEQPFSDWVIQRLERTFDDTHSYSSQERRNHRQQLAQLMLHYPLHATQKNALFAMQHRFEDLHEQLYTDGWVIESDDGYSQIVHDIFADQIVLNALRTSAASRVLEKLATEVWQQAAQVNNLAPVLVSWQRLANERVIKDFDWLKLIQQQIAGLTPGSSAYLAWQQVRALLILFTPLTLAQLLEVIEQFPDFWQGVTELDVFCQALDTRLVKEWAGLPHNIQNKVRSWLNQLHEQTGYLNTELLSVAVKLDCEHFSPVFDRFLEQCLSPVQEMKLFRIWLASSGTPRLIWHSLKPFLQQNELLGEACFLYRVWLDSGGEVANIKPFLLAWLEAHSQAPEAQFVYKAWLDAGGELSAVASFVLVWLEAHSQTPEAQFVYKAWLDAGGELSVVESFVLAWLEAHSQVPEAQFVYKGWLDAGGGHSAVAFFVLAWLEVHSQAPEAPFVYKAWLDSGGELSTVASFALAWLEAHSQTPEARFVYQAWLNARGELARIQTALTLWLERYQRLAESSFVVSAWIKAGGELSLVEPAINAEFARLQNHAEPTGKEFVAQLVHVYYLLREIPDKAGNKYWQQLLAGFVTWFVGFADFSVLAQQRTHWQQQSPGFIHLIEEALQIGELQSAQAKTQLRACFNWVNSWPDKRKRKIKYSVLAIQRKWQTGFEVTFN